MSCVLSMTISKSCRESQPPPSVAPAIMGPGVFLESGGCRENGGCNKKLAMHTYFEIPGV